MRQHPQIWSPHHSQTDSWFLKTPDLSILLNPNVYPAFCDDCADHADFTKCADRVDPLIKSTLLSTNYMCVAMLTMPDDRKFYVQD